MVRVSYRKIALGIPIFAILAFVLCLAVLSAQSIIAQESQDSSDGPYLITSAIIKQDGEYVSAYEVGVPVELTYYLHNPQVDVPAGVPIHLTVYDPDYNLIDDLTLYAEEDGMHPDDPVRVTYSFTPQTFGDYVISANGTYEELSSHDYRLIVKVRPSAHHTFEVEGKTSTATVDKGSQLKFVRSVELSVEEKK